MKPLTLAVACFALLVASYSVVLAEDSRYRTQIDVYRIQGDISGDTSLTDNIVAGLEDQILSARKGRFIFFTLADLTIAGVKFEADENGWTWNGKPNLPKHHRIQLISGPRVLSGEREVFAFHVGSKQPVQYFERCPDGLFQLKSCDVPVGISLEATVEQGESGRVIVRDLKILADLILRRRPIQGVTLNVGEPIVEPEEYKTTLSIKPGRYYGIQLLTERHGCLIIRLRVDPQNET